MHSNIQQNIGDHIKRQYPVLEFLGQVWGLNINDLPDNTYYNLPRPVRRLLARFKPETLRRLDVRCGLPPSRLAVTAAKFAWEEMKEGIFGLVEDASGRWEDVEGFNDMQAQWQRILCIVEVHKGWARTPESLGNVIPGPIRVGADEAGFAERLMNLFCSNMRSWVSGILIQGTTASFWYADRMGVIVSSRFSCIDQPNLLYLAGLAIGSSTRNGLGISPFLAFLERADATEAAMDFRNAYIWLPAPTVDAGERPEEIDELAFGESNWEAPDVANGQLVGRGTVVIPVRATCAAAVQRFGRYRTSVLKLAWAAATSPVEDATVRLIRTRLQERRPDMVAHVTHLKASLTMTMDRVGLPRASMFVMEEQRVLRIQLLERYSPLESVNSVEDFKVCFLDVVNAHHWVLQTSGILHRDISADNIMVQQIGGFQRGVLADWDLAKGPSLRTRRPRQRFGTLPFLSADFNARWWQGEHYYRHDLEALMNLLAWFCACYVPSSYAVNTKFLPLWYEDWENGYGWSRRFLSENYETVMANAHPEYRALADEWVKPLSGYFQEVTGSTYSQLDTLHRLDRGERWGIWATHSLSPATITREIERITKERDEAIDFQGFMACLGQ